MKYTMANAKELQKKYGMGIMRDPITREAKGLTLTSDGPVDELEEMIAELDRCVKDGGLSHGWIVDRTGSPDHPIYRIWLPTDWFDLWGWRDN